MMPKRFSRGFTLVELLVVMTLMSLVMLALFSAMRSMAQTEARIDARLARADEFRTAVSFMRTTLERVSARKIEGLQAGASTLPFAATPGAVAWVGVMPARYGAGGRCYFQLGAEQASDGETALVIRFVPWTNDGVPPKWPQSQSRVLAERLVKLELRYQDPLESPSQWRADWPFKDRLPSAVGIRVQTQAEIWPDLIVAMRVLPGGSDASNKITF